MRAFGKQVTVVPNGFDDAFLRTAQRAVEWRESLPDDGIVRIGYAAGTMTHQQDLSVALPALVQILKEHSEVRFVCFEGAIDLSEFPELTELSGQLEVRPLVPIAQLPYEYTRFDVNIAPLVVNNPFCEAKSELKFFEAVLAGVVPSPHRRSRSHRRCETARRDSWPRATSRGTRVSRRW